MFGSLWILLGFLLLKGSVTDKMPELCRANIYKHFHTKSKSCNLDFSSCLEKSWLIRIILNAYLNITLRDQLPKRSAYHQGAFSAVDAVSWVPQPQAAAVPIQQHSLCLLTSARSSERAWRRPSKSWLMSGSGRAAPYIPSFDYKRMKQKSSGLVCFPKIAGPCTHCTPFSANFFLSILPFAILYYLSSFSLSSLNWVPKKQEFFPVLISAVSSVPRTVYSNCRGLQF